MFTDEAVALMRETIAETIAKSRYEAWDANATKLCWEEFKVHDPRMANDVYLADGRRDAEKVVPVVTRFVAVGEAYGQITQESLDWAQSAAAAATAAATGAAVAVLNTVGDPA